MTNEPRNHRVDFVEFGASSVEHLARTKIFYQSVFGWSFTEWGSDYIDTKDSSVGTGINADPKHRPQHPLAVIFADDLESAKANVLSSDGTLTKDIFSFPGGRRFHFKDPAGNELAVWSDR